MWSRVLDIGGVAQFFLELKCLILKKILKGFNLWNIRFNPVSSDMHCAISILIITFLQGRILSYLKFKTKILTILLKILWGNYMSLYTSRSSWPSDCVFSFITTFTRVHAASSHVIGLNSVYIWTITVKTPHWLRCMLQHIGTNTNISNINLFLFLNPASRFS